MVCARRNELSSAILKLVVRTVGVRMNTLCRSDDTVQIKILIEKEPRDIG